MEEKVIKRSPKKIIWNALFGLASVLFFLLPLYYIHSYSQKGTRLHTISLLFMLVLLFFLCSSSLSDLQTFKFGQGIFEIYYSGILLQTESKERQSFLCLG